MTGEARRSPRKPSGPGPPDANEGQALGNGLAFALPGLRRVRRAIPEPAVNQNRALSVREMPMGELPRGPQIERRKDPRLKTNLVGRYMLANRRECLCTVIDASSSGLTLAGPEHGAVGETAIVYLLSGRRPEPGGRAGCGLSTSESGHSGPPLLRSVRSEAEGRADQIRLSPIGPLCAMCGHRVIAGGF